MSPPHHIRSESYDSLLDAPSRIDPAEATERIETQLDWTDANCHGMTDTLGAMLLEDRDSNSSDGRLDATACNALTVDSQAPKQQNPSSIRDANDTSSQEWAQLNQSKRDLATRQADFERHCEQRDLALASQLANLEEREALHAQAVRHLADQRTELSRLSQEQNTKNTQTNQDLQAQRLQLQAQEQELSSREFQLSAREAQYRADVDAAVAREKEDLANRAAQLSLRERKFQSDLTGLQLSRPLPPARIQHNLSPFQN